MSRSAANRVPREPSSPARSSLPWGGLHIRTSTLALVLVLLLPGAAALLPGPLQADAGVAGDAPSEHAQARVLPGPGEYGGELAYPTDYDDAYAATLAPGARTRFTLLSRDGAAIELYAPDGSLAQGTGAVMGEASVEAAGPGRWIVLVRVFSAAELPYVLRWDSPASFAPTAPLPSVVVATFDTGTNPFHPCFRRDQAHPALVNPDYPAASTPLPLVLGEDYAGSRLASEDALAGIEPGRLYHVPGTSLSFYGAGTDAPEQLVDTYPHGAQASSQIGCREYGLAPHAQLVILNWYAPGADQAAMLDWVARQPWIDVVHLNVQDLPLPLPHTTLSEAIAGIIASGKLVVIAAGNGVAGYGASYPMELSSHNGPPGSLIAGANDNGGYTYYSNLDPHVVMDGMGTLGAAPASFGSTNFSGTSSASPRLAGYAARILGELRAEHGDTGAGLLSLPRGAWPATGPLMDGALTAAELHEVIRKTADPHPHASELDGGADLTSPPETSPFGFAFYPKMGYGEVSERTLPAALAVASGRAPMPDRFTEDQSYHASETARAAYWDHWG